MSRIKLDRKEWNAIIDDCFSSQQSQKDYCEEHNLNFHTLQYMKKKLGREYTPIAHPKELIPVEIKAEVKKEVAKQLQVLCKLKGKNNCEIEIYEVQALEFIMKQMM